MKRMFVFISLMALHKLAGQAPDDEGFRSIAEYRAFDPAMVAHVKAQNIDDVFGAPEVVKLLSETKRVRLFRQPLEIDESALSYADLRSAATFEHKLNDALTLVELSPSVYQPILKLAADFNQYSDETLCGFNPGIALILGDRPDFIMICCFECHEVCVIRRSTDQESILNESYFSMSPELERVIFDLARSSYPRDKKLRDFKLKTRQRAKRPLTQVPLGGSGKDPFGVH